MQNAEIKFQLWTMLAFALGLRREEIFGLQINDIDFDKNTLAINRAVVYVHGEGVIVKNTKTKGSKLLLAMPSLISELLKKYLESIKQSKVVNLSERWLFYRQNGHVSNPESFNDFLKRFQKEHGSFGITPHILRHMYGSYLVRSGIDIALASHQLGHTNKSFTADTYIHVTEKAETRAAEVMQNVVDEIMGGQ